MSCRLDLNNPVDITPYKSNGNITFTIDWKDTKSRNIVLQILPQKPNGVIENTDIGTAMDGANYKVIKLNPGINNITIPMSTFKDLSTATKVYSIVVHLGLTYQKTYTINTDNNPSLSAKVWIMKTIFNNGSSVSDAGGGAKARIEDQIPPDALKAITQKFWERLPVEYIERDGKVFYLQGAALEGQVIYNGVQYSLIYEGKGYFSIMVDDGNTTKTVKISAVPLSPREVIIPKRLAGKWDLLKRESRIYTQMGVHEGIEMGDLEGFQGLYKELQEQDRIYVRRLLTRLGVVFKYDENDYIGDFESNSPHLKHILGEVAELMIEHIEGDYSSMSEVVLSSLDAAVLVTRLEEITGVVLDGPRIDNLVGKLTAVKPTPRQIILSMVAEDRFDLDIIEKSAEAFAEVEDSIIDSREIEVKTILLYAREWKEETREIKDLSDVLKNGLLERFKSGIEKAGYGNQWDRIEDILRLIRYELGRTVKTDTKAGRSIRVNNPYLHGLINRLSQMAGVRTEEMLWAYYKDLFQGRGVPTMRLVNSVLEIALTEAEHARYQGLIALEKGVSASLTSKVGQLATAIYKEKAESSTGQFINVVDLSMGLTPKTDPLAVMGDIFIQSKGKKFGCKTTDGLLANHAIAEYLAAERAILARRNPVVVGLDTEGNVKEPIISLSTIVEIERYNEESMSLSVIPKGIGLGQVFKGLKNVRIADFNREELRNKFASKKIPDGVTLDEFINKAISEALTNIFGIENAVLVVDSLENVLATGNVNTVVLVDEGEADNVSTNGKFVYAVRSGELLIDTLSVSLNVDFKEDGTFSDDSKTLLRGYYSYLIPEKEKGMVQEFIDNFNLLKGVVFKLPPIVKFTQLLEELKFSLSVDLSA